MAASGEAALVVEEARLARAAAAGDGSAFADLYERYGRRAYNLAYRITASEHDAADVVQEAFLSVMRRLPELGERDLAFGSYLFTATRNASYDLMRDHRRAQPSDSIPEAATPLGTGAGGLGLDPGDPEEDPDRSVLLSTQQEEIREANGRLPERQREALALRELEDLSYDEIAAVMDMNRNSVAQLISRARINLRDELRGTALTSVAVSSPECERALPLIAMRDDGQLGEGSGDAAWLEAHLSGCERCQVATEAMQEAGASYRAWVPVAIAPWLFKATMARAAELTGADWSEEVAEAPATGPFPGMPSAYLAQGEKGRGGSRRRRAALAAALATLLLGGGVAAVLAADDEDAPAPSHQAADLNPAGAAEGLRRDPKARARHRAKRHGSRSAPQEPPATSQAGTDEAAAPTSRGQTGSRGQGRRSPSRSGSGSGEAGLDRTSETPDHPPKAEPEAEPETEPAPAPSPEAAPQPEEPPATTTPPPAEEPPEEEEPAGEREPPAGVPPGAGRP